MPVVSLGIFLSLTDLFTEWHVIYDSTYNYKKKYAIKTNTISLHKDIHQFTSVNSLKFFKIRIIDK